MAQECPHCRKRTISYWRKMSMGVVRSSAVGTTICSNCGARVASSRVGAWLAIAPLLAYAVWVSATHPSLYQSLMELAFVGVVTLYAQIRLVPLVEVRPPMETA